MMEYYRLVGAINLFGLYPDFLFPVYERGNEYFFHNGSNNQIECFDRVKDSIIENIILFKDTDCPIINICRSQMYYKEGKPAYAFQDENKIVFCSDLDVMLMYLDSYQTEDVYVKEAIYQFILENKLFYEEKKDSFPIEDYINLKFPTVMKKKPQNNAWRENSITTMPVSFGEQKRNFIFRAMKGRNKYIVDEQDKKGIHEEQLVLREHDRDIQEYNAWNILSPYISSYRHGLFSSMGILQGIINLNEELLLNEGLFEDRELLHYFNELLFQCSIDSELYKLCIECIYAIIHQDKEKLRMLLKEHQDIFSRIYENRM